MKLVSKNSAAKYERFVGYHLNVTMDCMILSFLEIALSILMEGIYIIPLYLHICIYIYIYIYDYIILYTYILPNEITVKQHR